MSWDTTSINLVRHDDIRRRLRAKGVRLLDIAVETSRQSSLVTQTSQGYRRCPEIEEAIARHLDQSVDSLFPERYGPSTTEQGDQP
ncbi:helix-turn-helix domain-containing protein [Thioclava sp. GXIMD4215]|uniref:helix-turn-helix domain-containing protein n=1 Tax=unclassified Thioclava TaxID=2621713 RepID=UPI003873CB81